MTSTHDSWRAWISSDSQRASSRTTSGAAAAVTGRPRLRGRARRWVGSTTASLQLQRGVRTAGVDGVLGIFALGLGQHLAVGPAAPVAGDGLEQPDEPAIDVRP